MKRKLMVWAMIALFLSCSAAWAQSGTGVLGGLAGTILGTIGAPDIITGTLLPFLIMLVVQSGWTWKAKANISWMICLAAAVVVAAMQGQLALDWTAAPIVAAKFGTLVTVAKNLYDGVYKPLGVADKVTKASDFSKDGSTPGAPPMVAPVKPTTTVTPSNVLDETPVADFNAGDFNIESPVPAEKVDLKDSVKDELIHGAANLILEKLSKKVNE